jgi:hypothetical protein
MVVKSGMTGSQMAILGVSLAVEGLKKDAADAAEIVERFPKFVWLINDALNKCVSSELAIEAAPKITYH